MIPRKFLFGNPDKTLPTLSPDGTRIAYPAPVDGVMTVWVAPADDITDAQPVTDDKDRGIGEYFWAYTNRHILYKQDEKRDDNFHVHCVDLDSGQVTDLTPIDGIQARVGQVRANALGAGGFSPGSPNEILVATNDRLPQFHDYYLIDLDTGNRRMVQQASEDAQFFMFD